MPGYRNNSWSRWTEEEDDRLYHLYKRGWSVYNIARDLGRTQNAIRARLRNNYGIDPDGSGSGRSYSTPYSRTSSDSLFEQLKEWRYEVSQDKGIPAYCVFTDATLQEIAEERPTTKSELLNIYGVGQAKLDEYGAAVIRIVKQSI